MRIHVSYRQSIKFIIDRFLISSASSATLHTPSLVDEIFCFVSTRLLSKKMHKVRPKPEIFPMRRKTVGSPLLVAVVARLGVSVVTSGCLCRYGAPESTLSS